MTHNSVINVYIMTRCGSGCLYAQHLGSGDWRIAVSLIPACASYCSKASLNYIPRSCTKKSFVYWAKVMLIPDDSRAHIPYLTCKACGPGSPPGGWSGGLPGERGGQGWTVSLQTTVQNFCKAHSYMQKNAQSDLVVFMFPWNLVRVTSAGEKT